MDKLRNFGYLLVSLGLIYLGYDTYTTGTWQIKGHVHNLSNNEKLFTSLFLIIAAFFIIYLLVSYGKRNTKKNNKDK